MGDAGDNRERWDDGINNKSQSSPKETKQPIDSIPEGDEMPLWLGKLTFEAATEKWLEGHGYDDVGEVWREQGARSVVGILDNTKSSLVQSLKVYLKDSEEGYVCGDEEVLDAVKGLVVKGKAKGKAEGNEDRYGRERNESFELLERLERQERNDLVIYWARCYAKYSEVAGEEIDEEVMEVAKRIVDIGESMKGKGGEFVLENRNFYCC